MKNNHVYGIGNAMVDMEFEVSTDYLKKMSVDKGLMTLVDEARQEELLNHLDGVVHKRTCGGSAANTMIAIAQFGGKAFYSCKVASDEPGDFYVQDLVENGVQSNATGKRPAGKTGKCMVMITPDAERSMNTFLGITETFSSDELVEESIKNSEYLYMEGYLVTSPTGRPAAIRAREIAESAGVKTALTFSDPNMVNFFKDGLSEMIGRGVDLLFCNEAEALEYTKCNSIEKAAEQLKSVAKTLAITLGDKGALLYDGRDFITVHTDTVKPVDTNGAGDLFAGTFLYGITHGLDFKSAGTLACRTASVLVTQFGARLSKDQVQQIKQELSPFH